LLRHATPTRNLPSIIKVGLLTSRSPGKLPVEWVCCPAKTAWAALHTIRRYGVRVEGVVVLEIAVARAWLKRPVGATQGLRYSTRDIVPRHIRRVITFGELGPLPGRGAGRRGGAGRKAIAPGGAPAPPGALSLTRAAGGRVLDRRLRAVTGGAAGANLRDLPRGKWPSLRAGAQR
jgi:hypothetical protein